MILSSQKCHIFAALVARFTPDGYVVPDERIQCLIVNFVQHVYCPRIGDALWIAIGGVQVEAERRCLLPKNTRGSARVLVNTVGSSIHDPDVVSL